MVKQIGAEGRLAEGCKAEAARQPDQRQPLVPNAREDSNEDDLSPTALKAISNT